MSAGDRYAAELLRVVCPEDHGDPFEWWNPPVPAVAPPAAPDGPQGPGTAPRPAHGRSARFLARRRTT